MPVLPNFSSFAPTPNNANAWMGGVAIANREKEVQAQLIMEQRKLDQQAKMAEMEHAMQQQRLAESTRTATMENQMQRQKLDEMSLRAQQEMNIKNQYDQQVLGLKSQELQGKQATLKLKTEEAARRAAAMEEYKARFPNEDPNDLARELFPRMGVGASSFNQLFSTEDDGKAQLPATITDAEGLEGYKVFTPPKGPVRLVQTPSTIQNNKLEIQKNQIEAQKKLQEGKQEYQKKVADDRETVKLITELSKLNENAESKDAYIKQRRGEKLSDEDELLAEEYSSRKALIDQLSGELGKKHGAEIPKSVRKSEPEYKHASEVPVGGTYKGSERLEGDWQSPKSWKKL